MLTNSRERITDDCNILLDTEEFSHSTAGILPPATSDLRGL